MILEVFFVYFGLSNTDIPCFACACTANLLAFRVESVDDPWSRTASNKLVMHEHAFSKMCSAWIPCHTFRTATAAVRLSSEPWVRRDVISSVRRLARVRSRVMCYLEKKKQGNRVDYYYYPYFNCFSCHSDSSFLTHSVLSRFFMSDVSVRSIPTSLKMEFIKKEWGRPLKLFTETLERDWWYFDAEDHSSSSVCFAPAVMTFEKTSRTCTQKKKLKRPTAFKYGSEVFMGTRVEQPCTALSVFCGFLSIFPAF